MYEDRNSEEWKMNLLGPIYTLPRGSGWFSPQGVCFQNPEAFCKEGNVGILEEPLTGNDGYLVKPFVLPTLIAVDDGWVILVGGQKEM